MTRLLRNDDIFLLRIDAKKGHYCRVQPTADPACIRCAAQETLAPTLIQPGNSASRSGEAFIDITGEACPMTFVRVKLKLEPLPAGTLLKVRLSGTEAVTNVPLSLRHAGHEVVSLAQCEGVYELLVKKCDTKLREE
ncbi:MAG: sulfurtransferase TusA family protein [Magnetococcales bacterium]|nr:sulfurtransferase TusA family protein [Magnetococcales bacterium]MBF0151611.1 sulfurtransferase TusA family protein [Magnetococcales bacterium]MBF0631521.1 sulfurtransferase TusA family protein [Magnetococcales bacterium]